MSALKIVNQLQKNGHTTYLVGGCVRDLLMGLTPKDFDISTTARPQQVKKLVKNAFIIGRRFRLVLVRRGDSQYEVATFRRGLLPEEDEGGLLDRENIFGTPKQDAKRRDYTCNALFYDPIKRAVLDYTSGIQDMKEGWLKLIGKPKDRLPEDPIRILRALRFAVKLGFQIEPKLYQGLCDFADELKPSSVPRKREEFLKILMLKNPGRVFNSLKDLGILDKILPTLNTLTTKPHVIRNIFNTFEHLDYHHRLTLNPAQLLGVFAWAIAINTNIDFEYEDLSTWIQDKSIQDFMKLELGAFNAELIHIEQAFRLVTFLMDYDTFLEKGIRRRLGLLSQKAFPLSLFFYACINGPDLGLWIDAFNSKDSVMSLHLNGFGEKIDDYIDEGESYE